MNNFNEMLRLTLEQYKQNLIDIGEVINLIKKYEFEDIGFAKIDHKRSIFKNFPEVIFGIGKTDEQIIEIFKKMAMRSKCVMATRVNPKVYEILKEHYNDLKYDSISNVLYLGDIKHEELRGNVALVSAGTADLKVAEEAAITLELSGSYVERIYDVGVAGIKRLFKNLDKILKANVVIVVAGMEGALCSVVAGLVSVPVIGVPTSIGYGANFNGISALLAMLNSCSPGVSVVNIDNGFGAGFLASQINLQIENAKLKKS